MHGIFEPSTKHFCTLFYERASGTRNSKHFSKAEY